MITSKKFAEALEGFRAKLEEIKNDLDAFKDERRSEWDEKSERWQDSEKGQAVQECIYQLETSSDAIESAWEEFPEWPS